MPEYYFLIFIGLDNVSLGMHRSVSYSAEGVCNSIVAYWTFSWTYDLRFDIHADTHKCMQPILQSSK